MTPDLEERVAALEGLLRLREPDAYEQHLSPQEARVWRILRRGYATRQAIADVMGLTPNCVSVHVRKVRQKLSPLGVTIRPVKGYGYVTSTQGGNHAVDQA